MHAARLRAHGTFDLPPKTEKPKCAIIGCSNFARAAKSSSYATSLCNMHRLRHESTGSAGENTSRKTEKGKGHVSKHGYRYFHMPQHPNASKYGVVAEHTVVMSQLLGRALKPGENIHHKNGIRDDNRPENLELWTKQQPAGKRVVDIFNWCKSYIAEYEPVISIITHPS
jgi:hypothetical protein